MPESNRFAVALTFDFDAQCLWMGMLGSNSAQYMSRGEFDAAVGAPRVLDVLRDRGLRSTWFIPGHSLVTFPEVARRVVEGGHEIAAHGCFHESIPQLSPAEERRLMRVQLDQHLEVVGAAPRGYRSPAWDYSATTVQLLDESGFDWDSSLMADDFEPYRRDSSTCLQMPVSYTLDDMPDIEFIAGLADGFGDPRAMERRWLDIFDYGRREHPGGVMNLTMHPQAIGRAHHSVVLERILDEMLAHDDVWFPTLSEAHDAWRP
jgi:peptidoglycan/xylan/chitin deacetylase (PgdA/CDA1 family)